MYFEIVLQNTSGVKVVAPHVDKNHITWTHINHNTTERVTFLPAKPNQPYWGYRKSNIYLMCVCYTCYHQFNRQSPENRAEAVTFVGVCKVQTLTQAISRLRPQDALTT